MQTANNDFILYFYAFRQQAFSCNAWLTLVRATQKANSHRNEYFFSSQQYQTNHICTQEEQEEKKVFDVEEEW